MNTKKYFKEIFETNKKHDPVVDGIRALSVLSIIVFHIVVGIIQVFDHDKAKQYILDIPSLLRPLWHGEKGVDAFFLLSALVVGIPFFKNIEKFDLHTAKVFLKKKLLRIYPLFFIALVLYTIAQWSYFGKYFFSNLFFLNNIISGERTIIPVGWFLTVEVQYFVLTPLLFLALKKIKYRGVALTALFLSSIVVCAAVLLKTPGLYTRPITDLFLAQDRGEFSDQIGRLFYESPLTRYGPYVAGFLLAYLRVFYSAKLAELFKNKLASAFALGIAAIFIIVPITVPMYDPNSWFYRPFSVSRNFWTLVVSRQVFATGIALIILGGWYSFGGVFKVTSRILGWRAWGPISKLSFPMYLFHFPFIAIAAVITFGTTNTNMIISIGIIQGMMIFLLATALTFIFSIPFYIYIERPIIERGKKITES
mgnify:CR=1 FL=1